MATSSKSTPGLQKCAQDATIEALGKLSKRLSSRFCCGGKLQPAESRIRLNYEVESEIAKLVLPSADEAALAKLVSASSVATYDKDNQQVTDLSYCDAYEIDPDKLMTSFCLCNTKILSEIESLMVPNRSIRAELCKLNLYTGPGGQFKSHVDTPCSGGMFGSLVICLPTQFSGGALVTRYGGQEVVFDWSSLSDDPLSVVCWAAFFSNVEHEILPVTSGHHLTLTYNLYTTQEMLHSVSPHGPLCDCFQRAISTPHFMRDGGCLIFHCEHLYAFGMLNEKEQLPRVLKGADYLIFSTAKMLNLRVTVKPIVEGDEYTSLLPYFPCCKGLHFRAGDRNFCDEFDVSDLQSLQWDVILYSIDSQDAPIVIPPDSIKICHGGPDWDAAFSLIRAPIKTTLAMLEEADAYMNKVSLQKAGVDKEDIPIILDACTQVECTEQQKNPSLGCILYSYKVEIEVCQYAVILVEVPPWGDSPRTLVSDSDSPVPEKKQKVEQEYQHLFDEDKKKLYCWKNN